MPDKITKRSRNVGSRKPPKTPKPESPTPSLLSDWSDTPTDEWGFEGSTVTALPSIPNANTSNSPSQPNAYTGVSQVQHGLTFPTFNPNSYFPSDIFNDTSALEGISKEEADRQVHSIEEKRQRMRIVLANQGLMQDIIKGGMEHRKIEGLAIDFDKLRIDNETKFIGWQTAGLTRDIAINKWQQTRERLIQGEKTLTGMRGLTELIDEEWTARRQLKVSSINDLKTKALRGSSAMDAKLSATIDTISASDYDD